MEGIIGDQCRWQARRDEVPAEVDARLLQWVRWTRERASSLGFPPRTLLAKIIEEGWHGAAQFGRPEPEIPEPVMEVDRIVAQMPWKLRRVLRAYYLSGLPIEVKARQLGMSISTVRNRLEAARWFVAAKLC